MNAVVRITTPANFFIIQHMSSDARLDNSWHRGLIIPAILFCCFTQRKKTHGHVELSKLESFQTVSDCCHKKSILVN